MPALDFDFLKSRYDFELQRREQQTASLGLPVGVLGGLGSVMALMARSFTWSDRLTTTFFAPLLVSEIIAFVSCMVYLSRVYHRQTYVYLPKLADLDRTRAEWREFYETAKVPEPEADDAFFELEFRRRIIDATDRNTDINDERSALLYWARIWLMSVLWLTTLGGIPFVVDQVRHNMTRPSTTQNPQPATSNPQSSTPQPPAFPPNREIREGDIPRRTTPPSR